MASLADHKPKDSTATINPNPRDCRDKSTTLAADIDWPGRMAFAELGAFQRTVELKFAGSITGGVFLDLEEGVTYVASCRPRAVGMGRTQAEATEEWIGEIQRLRDLARELRPPYGPTTENDIQCLRDFFGSL